MKPAPLPRRRRRDPVAQTRPPRRDEQSHDVDGPYETHEWLEIDLGTEHMPRIQAKCRMAPPTPPRRLPSCTRPTPARRLAQLRSRPPTRSAKGDIDNQWLARDVFRVSSPEAFLAAYGSPTDDKSASPATPVSAGNLTGLGQRSERQCQSDTPPEPTEGGAHERP